MESYRANEVHSIKKVILIFFKKMQETSAQGKISAACADIFLDRTLSKHTTSTRIPWGQSGGIPLRSWYLHTSKKLQKTVQMKRDLQTTQKVLQTCREIGEVTYPSE